MGARPSPVIDAGEQLDSRKVRGHGLLCEHRSALRASSNFAVYRSVLTPGGTVHTRKEPGCWSGSRYMAIKYLIKLIYWIDRATQPTSYGSHMLRRNNLCCSILY
jgi:hypothetical protein